MGGFQLLSPPADLAVSLAEMKLHVRQDSTADDALLQTLIQAATREAERVTGRQIVAAQWLETYDRFPTWLDFPAGTVANSSTAWGRFQSGLGVYGLAILIHKPPLISLDSMNYIDTTGTPQVVDPTLYRVSQGREPAIVEPAYGQIWPVPRIEIDAVNLVYTCGYPATSIPLAISAGQQTVTPASMRGIVVGTNLEIDLGTAQETVNVTAVGATTFTATFAQAHSAGSRANAVPDDIQAAIKLVVGHWYTNRETVNVGNIVTELPLAAMHLLLSNNYGGYP